jgi:hypothetical protein
MVWLNPIHSLGIGTIPTKYIEEYAAVAAAVSATIPGAKVGACKHGCTMRVCALKRASWVRAACTLACMVAFFDRDLHARMPLVPTPARVKRCHACDQWHSSRVSTTLPLTPVKLRPNTEGRGKRLMRLAMQHTSSVAALHMCLKRLHHVPTLAGAPVQMGSVSTTRRRACSRCCSSSSAQTARLRMGPCVDCCWRQQFLPWMGMG